MSPIFCVCWHNNDWSLGWLSDLTGGVVFGNIAIHFLITIIVSSVMVVVTKCWAEVVNISIKVSTVLILSVTSELSFTITLNLSKMGSRKSSKSCLNCVSSLLGFPSPRLGLVFNVGADDWFKIVWLLFVSELIF